MNANLKKDFEIAERLNSSLTISSDCFDLSYFFRVSCIVCADDVFAIEVAKLLRENFEKYGLYPKIIVRSDLALLSYGELDLDEWWRLVSKILEIPFEPAEVMLVARREIAEYAATDIMLTDIKVAVLEQFMQNDCGTRTFLSYRGEMNGMIKLQNCDYFVLYGDDVTIVKDAKKTWELLKLMYGDKGPSGEMRKIIYLGGRSKFSELLYSHLINEKHLSEATMLQKVGKQVFVFGASAIVLDQGDNIGSLLYDLQRTIGDKKAIMFLPQRYSLIVKYSQKQQFPKLNLRYLVRRETVEESCRYLNGMKFCNAKVALSFWAHVLPRWEKYSKPQAEVPAFMIPVFGVSDELRQEAKNLENKYLLKQRNHALLRYWQEFKLWLDLRRNGYLAAEEFKQLLHSL